MSDGATAALDDTPLDDLSFDRPPRDDAAIEADRLLVSIEGFEGPLDLLLTLARTQKVDLAQISVLQLAEQYLAFVARSQALRIELAADYLVMAAWLAYLKSRLLLPEPPAEEGPSGEELAARLAFQLERLEAMRRASAQLMARDQLGRDFFPRGMIETVTVKRRTEWSASLADLLKAYARVKTRADYEPLAIARDDVYAIDTALGRMRDLFGELPDWTSLSAFLPAEWQITQRRYRAALAATFAASLELVKRGEIELRQDSVFSPISVRPRAGGSAS